MEVREQLIALHKAQQVDLRALELDRQAETIPGKVQQLEGELETLRAELGTLNMEADALRAEQRDSEAQIRDDTAKVQKWKRRLNDIKTPREYQALSREVEGAERGVREREDRVLEILEELESRDAVIAEKKSALDEAEAEVSGKIRDLRSTESTLRKEANEIRDERAATFAELPDRVVKLYERMAGRRQGIAIALVTPKGNCSGCNVDLRPQHVVEIRRLNTIEQCALCQRILVLHSLVEDDAS